MIEIFVNVFFAIALPAFFIILKHLCSIFYFSKVNEYLDSDWINDNRFKIEKLIYDINKKIKNNNDINFVLNSMDVMAYEYPLIFETFFVCGHCGHCFRFDVFKEFIKKNNICSFSFKVDDHKNWFPDFDNILNLEMHNYFVENSFFLYMEDQINHEEILAFGHKFQRKINYWEIKDVKSNVIILMIIASLIFSFISYFALSLLLNRKSYPYNVLIILSIVYFVIIAVVVAIAIAILLNKKEPLYHFMTLEKFKLIDYIQLAPFTIIYFILYSLYLFFRYDSILRWKISHLKKSFHKLNSNDKIQGKVRELKLSKLNEKLIKIFKKM
jgi:hypothetical protein